MCEASLLDFTLSAAYAPSLVAVTAVYKALRATIADQAKLEHHAGRLAALSGYQPHDPELLACSDQFDRLRRAMGSAHYHQKTLKFKYDNDDTGDVWHMLVGGPECVR